MRLAYNPPYDWDAIAGFLAARAIPGVEIVDRERYRRTIELNGCRGWIEVRPGEGNSLHAKIEHSDAGALPEIERRLRRLFDLDADPETIGRHLARDARLAPLVAKRPGLRVPGGWDGFEIAVRAILGQQVTVRSATRLAGRFVELCGVPGIFPRAEEAAVADLSAMGMPAARIGALRTLAGALVADPGLLVRGVEALRALRGIGDWTAQYIAMRILRDPDAFPAADVVLLRAIFGSKERGAAAELFKRAEPWRPWRAYAAVHLWTDESARL